MVSINGKMWTPPVHSYTRQEERKEVWGVLEAADAAAVPAHRAEGTHAGAAMAGWKERLLLQKGVSP